MSATAPGEAVQKYFGSRCPSVRFPGRAFPVHALYLEEALSADGDMWSTPLEIGTVVQPSRNASRNGWLMWNGTVASRTSSCSREIPTSADGEPTRRS